MTVKQLTELFVSAQTDYLQKTKNTFLSIGTKTINYTKLYSQFFTTPEIAMQMVELIDINALNKQSVKLLEPSAGCGILILFSVLKLIKNPNIQSISVHAYEIDTNLCKILYSNLNILSKFIFMEYGIRVEFEIVNKNFILDNFNHWNSPSSNLYDLIITNPPYRKINQSSEEAIMMHNIVYGQPNLYSLFICLCLKLLNKETTYNNCIILSPRSYLSGIYFKKTRNFIFKDYYLTDIHLFKNRNVFKLVSQEVIISCYTTHVKDMVNISYDYETPFKVMFEQLIHDIDIFSILVPTKKDDLNLLHQFNNLRYSLKDLNLKVSVGPIVQFRNTKFISKDIYSDSYAPLVIAYDILSNNVLQYYSRENHTLRSSHNKSISINAKYLIPNSNYLLLRKISAKDDAVPILPLVLDKNYFNHSLLGLDNNVLYFHAIDYNELSLELCYGLYAYINSIYFSSLYQMINGSHTINVTDFNYIKFPSKDRLCKIGTEILSLNLYDSNSCTSILLKYLN